MKKSIAIIGGGASGLISAISAANYAISKKISDKVEIMILEKSDRVGRKILATGNGRCNITNTDISIDRYHGNNTKFAADAFSIFSVDETIKFFNDIGLHLKVEELGKVYPYSGQASAVLDVLRMKCQELGIREVCGFFAKYISRFKGKFKIVSSDDEVIEADRVIICCGGAASPNLGSDGSGYKLLTSFGHKKLKVFSSIVQIKTETKHTRALKGIKFKGNISISTDTSIIKTDYGEILFTDYGLSGPPVMQLSRIVSEHFNVKYKNNGNLYAVLDFMPDWDADALESYIFQRVRILKDRKLETFFTGLLNKRIGQAIIKYCDFPLSMYVSDIGKNNVSELCRTIKFFPIQCTGTMPLNNAQVTAGGIDVSGFNSATMESMLVKGLYAAGEILDIDGDCGGFNLQWAWTSGYIAGLSCIESLFV